jgi:hypothetical protein
MTDTTAAHNEAPGVVFHTPTGLGWHIQTGTKHFIVSATTPSWINGNRTAVDVFRCDADGWVEDLKTVATVEGTINHWDGIDALVGAK